MRGVTVARLAMVAAACGAVVGCGASSVEAPAAVTVTTSSPEDAPREPDGVVLEPAAAVPEAKERAEAGGVVALRAPLGSEAVTTVVHRLFRAFAHEDVEALQAILTDDASVLGGVSSNRAPHGNGALLEQWRTRLKNPAYARLAGPGADLVEPDHIARFDYDDLGAPGAPERPSLMKPGELLVRFVVATPRVGTERLFGDAMTLLLRRDGRTYKIAAAGEDNPP